MRFVADESVDAQTVGQLRADGHDVLYVAEASPSLPDEDVLDRTRAGKAVLVTADKDFGELVFRLGRVTHGVILVRLRGSSPAKKAAAVSEAVRAHGDEMRHAFTVISPGMVRIRRNL